MVLALGLHSNVVHARLLQLINGVKLPAVVDSLLHCPKWRNPPDLNPSCWGARGDILTPQVRKVSRNVRWRIVLLQSTLVASYVSLR